MTKRLTDKDKITLITFLESRIDCLKAVMDWDKHIRYDNYETNNNSSKERYDYIHAELIKVLDHHHDRLVKSIDNMVGKLYDDASIDFDRVISEKPEVDNND